MRGVWFVDFDLVWFVFRIVWFPVDVVVVRVCFDFGFVVGLIVLFVFVL